MKDKTKNVIYQILHPEYFFAIIKNHVTNDELTEIFRIIKIIHEYDIFYSNNQDIAYENYELFRELCSIKNRKYLKYVTKELFDYDSILHSYNLYNMKSIVYFIRAYVDYNKYNDLIYYNMSNALWYNYLCDDRMEDDKLITSYGNIFRKIVEDIKLRKDLLGSYYEGFLDFMKLYFTYIFMNQDIYDEDLLLNGYKLILRNHYLEHMALNGTFNKDLKNNLKIKMFYIKEIINSLNNKKTK